MTAPRRPVLRYYGGKWSLAPWVIGFFPAHIQYVEPFGGGASVLMRKPRSRAEVYNDLDAEIVNLFHVLRDRVAAAELQRYLQLTPYSRAEFLDAYTPTEDPVERARRTVVRSLMGHGSSGANGVKRTGFRRSSGRSSGGGFSPGEDWVRWRDGMAAIVDRLQGVIIDNIDAAEVFQKYDTPETVFYVDPPYPLSTRGLAFEGSTRHAGIDVVYRHDVCTDDEHRALGAILNDLQGMVVLSGYPCDLYDTELFAHWGRHERQHRADSQVAKTEVVWLNPACSAALEAQKGQHSFAGLA